MEYLYACGISLCERLSEAACAALAVHLPDPLAAHALWGDGNGAFSVWGFHERFARKAGIAPTHAARYARQVGSVLADAVPTKGFAGARGELPASTGSWRSACYPSPAGTHFFEKV